MAKKKSWKQIRGMLAVFLALNLILTPWATAQTLYEEPAPTETTSVQDISASSDQTKLEHYPVIVQEDISKRGEYEKHFLNDDGSYTAVSYSEPVHYQNDDGSWIEIDNTLQEITKKDGTKRLETKDGLMDVSFDKHPGENMVSVAMDGYKITLGLVANKQEPFQTKSSATAGRNYRFLTVNKNITAKVSPNNFSVLPDEERKTVAKKALSKLVFEDALGSGTDIEYIVSANQIKENLILENDSDISSYAFRLVTNGLKAILNEDKTITLLDQSENTVFYMPAPYMYDSGDGYSDAIEVELIDADGYYLIIYTPDPAWLESPDRVWPVTVDPTIKTNTGAAYIDDRTVKNTGGTCPLTEPYLYVGLRNGQTHYSYIQHHYNGNNGMPTLPARSLIYKSYARVYINSSTASNVPLTVSMVNTSWNGNTLTYENRPTNLTTLASGITPTSGYYEFNITEALGRWYSGNTNTTGNNKNYGYMLSTTSGSESVKLYSSDYSDASMRPVISINYLPEVTSIPEGQYYIRNNLVLSGSTRFLDVHNSAVQNHQPLVTWKFGGQTCQMWNLTKLSDGSYKITSALTPPSGQQYSISVPGGTDANNVKLDMWLNQNAQAFTFHQRVSGSYYIRPYCSRIRVLEVPNLTATDVDSRNVKLFTANDGAGMQWQLQLVQAFSSNGGLSNRTVTIQLKGSTTTSTEWSKNIINPSSDAWNNSGAGTNISITTSSSPHTLTVDSYPNETWYGLCHKDPSGNVVATSSYILINLSQLGSKSTTFKRSTVAHEIGHLFWLGDNPPTTQPTLMSYSRDRETLFVPQTYDVKNVLFLYN